MWHTKKYPLDSLGLKKPHKAAVPPLSALPNDQSMRGMDTAPGYGQASQVDKDDDLPATERSSVKDPEIKLLLKAAPTDQIHDRAVYMNGVGAGYHE